MGWNPDRPPIEYLERRVRYYKRKAGSYRRTLREEPKEAFIRYFGSKKKWREAIQRTIDKAELRAKEYSDAVSKLKS
jgi:hypothetical protein